MEFLRYEITNAPAGTPPDVAVYQHLGRLVRVPVEVPEEQREAEAYNLLGLDQVQDEQRQQRLLTLRQEIISSLDLDDPNLIGNAQNLKVGVVLKMLQYLLREVDDLKSTVDGLTQKTV